MGSELKLVFRGKPISWKRPCPVRPVKFFDSQRKEKETLRDSVKRQSKKHFGDCPIEVLLLSFKEGRPDQENHFDTKIPDADNYVKFYLDALSKISYTDDRFIVKLTVEKKLSADPRVELLIRPAISTNKILSIQDFLNKESVGTKLDAN